MLKPINKHTVKKIIRNGGTFKGWIAPSNVNAFHVNGGWHIGMAVEFSDIATLEDTVQNFSWYNCNSELGNRVRFWTE